MRLIGEKIILITAIIGIILLVYRPASALAANESGKVLDINIDNQNGTISIGAVTGRVGNIPLAHTNPAANYTLAVVDKNGREIFKTGFGFTQIIFSDYFSKTASGNAQIQDQNSQIITVPITKDASKIKIFDAHNRLVTEENIALTVSQNIQSNSTQKTNQTILIAILGAALVIIAVGVLFGLRISRNRRMVTASSSLAKTQTSQNTQPPR